MVKGMRETSTGMATSSRLPRSWCATGRLVQIEPYCCIYGENTGSCTGRNASNDSWASLLRFAKGEHPVAHEDIRDLIPPALGPLKDAFLGQGFQRGLYGGGRAYAVGELELS